MPYPPHGQARRGLSRMQDPLRAGCSARSVSVKDCFHYAESSVYPLVIANIQRTQRVDRRISLTESIETKN